MPENLKKKQVNTNNRKCSFNIIYCIIIMFICLNYTSGLLLLTSRDWRGNFPNLLLRGKDEEGKREMLLSLNYC